ncbi:MAG: hypothetical protein M0Z47_08465, partial [Actinomycetota bacterium]|nr:hypothetical protein [Actinomycetota bacterium]
GEKSDRSPPLVGIEGEVDSPPGVQGSWIERRSRRRVDALTTVTAWHSKSLLPPETLDLLVITHPPPSSKLVMRRAIAPSGM